MKKGSETTTVMRSTIRMNPSNIKRHQDKDIKLQVKNIRKVGALGGIVANKDGVLIDGHRRIMALDIIHKYDGTPETDYEVKIEQVDFDEKTVKNQMAYMALGNSKADYNLVANIIGDIDYRDVGISEEDYQKILDLHPAAAEVGMGDFDDAFITPLPELDDSDEKTAEDIIREHEEKPKMTKEQVKAEKRKCDNVASNRQETQDLYVFLSFGSLENKIAFCDLLGVTPTNSLMVSGEAVLGLVE